MEKYEFLAYVLGVFAFAFFILFFYFLLSAHQKSVALKEKDKDLDYLRNQRIAAERALKIAFEAYDKDVLITLLPKVYKMIGEQETATPKNEIEKEALTSLAKLIHKFLQNKD